VKALVLREYGRLVLEDFPVPTPAPDEVLVRVRACGICGSDVHGFDGSTGRRIPPIIMGHEAAGEIAAVGQAVEGWKAGERVTFDSTIYCGQCWFCQRGRINLCENRRVLGVSCGEYRQHGAFADYVAVPQRILFRLPPALSFEHAAMVEAVSVAVHAVKRTPKVAEGTALVLGAGMIGLLVIQALRAAGWQKVIAVDLQQPRLELAARSGAYHALNADDADLLPRIRVLTEGRGVDASFEVVGLPATVKCAIDCVRKGGTVTLVGNLKPQAELPLQTVVTRELSLLGSCASAGEYPECLELIAGGSIKVERIISASAPLAEGPQWFKRLHAGEAGLMKVILKP
jgi:L-iditol 2-dehydrogenase